MDQCIPHVLRGSANLPALVIALHNYTLLRCYRFLPALRSAVLHDHPVRFRVERIRKDEEGRLQSVAGSCKRAGIRRRRTTPVKAATPRAAMAFTLRDALAILWSLMMILRFSPSRCRVYFDIFVLMHHGAFKHYILLAFICWNADET